jgi:nitrogen fixation NifU-like protein
MNRQEAIELLLEHYQSPHHHGKLPDADVSMPGGNPGCGDVITIFLKVDRDHDRVAEISFEGEGCTISQAAASLLTDMVEEASLDEIEAMDYHSIVDVIGPEIAATRPRCATLALGTLKAALKKYRRDRLRESLGENAGEENVPDHFEI